MNKPIIFISLLYLIIMSCEKENKLPHCDIISPTDNAFYYLGETITISVEATDPDGNIAEVRIFIDSIGVTSLQTFPYNHEWITSEEIEGIHEIKATAIDRKGAESSSVVSISLEIDYSANKGTFTDFRDDRTYKWIKINDQIWMAENLAYEFAGQNITDDGVWENNSSFDGWCYYENDKNTYGNTYGILYQWEVAKDACPDGWHVPSDSQWKEVEMYLGLSQVEADDYGLRGTDEGGKLKETGTTHWTTPNQGATNESGFTALAGGYRDYTGNTGNVKNDGLFWTSTEDTDTTGWYRYLHYDSGGIWRYRNSKKYGFSVRCIKDTD